MGISSRLSSTRRITVDELLIDIDSSGQSITDSGETQGAQVGKETVSCDLELRVTRSRFMTGGMIRRAEKDAAATRIKTR
ncbi:hypothetical protein [Actinoplanes sp. NPDC051859]|uniref:hypothetical protein n=1 Tax=Actinoplanes sp. NPDC051859 TaxID=3363909 RepID=UPI0037990FE8